MEAFHAQIYRINDVLGWHSRNELVLSPQFQRRRVWSPRGKSYLIDSIMNGMPLPQIFIREKVSPKERKTIREVVDGQQRLRAIIEYIEGKFTIMQIHNEKLAHITFDKLSEDIQTKFLSFQLSVNVLAGASDSDVLEIFSRLNAYSVPLNNQEKINAEFIGVFRKKMDALSKTHLGFWADNEILTSQQIARMKEVEFTCELVGAMLFGIQDGKSIIRDLYKRFDDEFPQCEYIENRFAETLQLSAFICGSSIASMEFSRSPLFYSLFCAIYDLKYGLKSDKEILPRQINQTNIQEVQQKLYKLNSTITGEQSFEEYKEFVTASKSSTDKAPQRNIRHNLLKQLIAPCFNND